MTRYAMKKEHNDAYLKDGWGCKSEFFRVYSLNYWPSIHTQYKFGVNLLESVLPDMLGKSAIMVHISEMAEGEEVNCLEYNLQKIGQVSINKIPPDKLIYQGYGKVCW